MVAGSRATVLLFVGTDCPISNRYAPELRRLYERYAPSGVAFWLVYADPAADAAAVRRHLGEYRLPEIALLDPGRALVKAAGVRVTPEAAVFVPTAGGPRLAYRGRIDDRYVALGRMRPAPTVSDLDEALAAILSGRPVPRETTPAVGCFIAGTP